jgi:hypothetical protein
MKISRILLIAVTAFVAQSTFAAKFQIVNTLPYPIKCVAKAKIFQTVFNGTIPANSTTQPIDIGNKDLQVIEWSYNNNKYFTDFDQYALKNNFTVPLRPNNKNFFNIYQNGFYMHNFDGTQFEGNAQEAA